MSTTPRQPDLVIAQAMLAAAIVADMTIVFGLMGRIHRYPESLGYEAEFKAIGQAWRPELGD